MHEALERELAVGGVEEALDELEAGVQLVVGVEHEEEHAAALGADERQVGAEEGREAGGGRVGGARQACGEGVREDGEGEDGELVVLVVGLDGVGGGGAGCLCGEWKVVEIDCITDCVLVVT